MKTKVQNNTVITKDREGKNVSWTQFFIVDKINIASEWERTETINFELKSKQLIEEYKKIIGGRK